MFNSKEGEMRVFGRKGQLVVDKEQAIEMLYTSRSLMEDTQYLPFVKG